MISNVAIQKLEDDTFLSFLGEYDKVEILLLLAGVKPALLLNWSGEKLHESEIKNQIKELEDYLKENNIFSSSFIFSDESPVWIIFTAARDEHVLHDLVLQRTVDTKDTDEQIKEKEIKIGLLLGYPETAVSAFANGTMIEEKDLPASITNSPEFAFVAMRLSQDNWRKEFELIKKSVTTIKEISPKIYADFLKLYSDYKRNSTGLSE